MSQAETPAKPKRIWVWALIAGWIAAIWAALASVAGYMSGPQPDGDPDTAVQVGAYILGYTFGAALLAGVITWVIFYLLVFRRRASIVKSLVVLPIMILGAFVIAAPLRFFAMVGHVQERTEAIAAWNTDASARMRRLTVRLDRDLAQVGDVSLAHLQTQNDIETVLANSQRVEALQVAHRAAIHAEIVAARQRVHELPLNREERVALLDQVEGRVFSRMRQEVDLAVDVAHRRVAMLSLLQTTKDKWTVQGGQVAFYDTPLMNQLTEMSTEHDRLVEQLNALTATPTGSAPPPRQ